MDATLTVGRPRFAVRALPCPARACELDWPPLHTHWARGPREACVGLPKWLGSCVRTRNASVQKSRIMTKRLAFNESRA